MFEGCHAVSKFGVSVCHSNVVLVSQFLEFVKVAYFESQIVVEESEGLFFHHFHVLLRKLLDQTAKFFTEINLIVQVGSPDIGNSDVKI